METTGAFNWARTHDFHRRATHCTTPPLLWIALSIFSCNRKALCKTMPFSRNVWFFVYKEDLEKSRKEVNLWSHEDK